MNLYRTEVTLKSNGKSDLVNFPRIPVVGDMVVLAWGMMKVVEVRLYYFADHHDNKPYHGIVAHIIVEET